MTAEMARKLVADGEPERQRLATIKAVAEHEYAQTKAKEEYARLTGMLEKSLEMAHLSIDCAARSGKSTVYFPLPNYSHYLASDDINRLAVKLLQERLEAEGYSVRLTLDSIGISIDEWREDYYLDVGWCAPEGNGEAVV